MRDIDPTGVWKQTPEAPQTEGLLIQGAIFASIWMGMGGGGNIIPD